MKGKEVNLGREAFGLGNQMDRRRVLRVALGVGSAALAGGALTKGAQATSGPAYFRTTANLNLRAKASTSGKVLLVIPVNSLVDNYGQSSNGYYKVAYKGTVGWAYSDYLEQVIPGDGDPDVNIIGNAVTTSAVNLRTGPSTAYDVLQVVKKGKSVEISDLVSGGYRYVIVDGTSGWIYDQYLDQGDAEGPIDFLTTSAVNLRKDPSTSAKIIKVVPKGATVTDYDLVMSNGYRGVDYKGTVGWIYDAYLTEK
jgi:uncharacterized protein YgiM (DUF1202 family)